MPVVIGLIIAFVLVAIFSRPKMRGCRWREWRGPGGVVYRCAACGAETRTDNGKPPQFCAQRVNEGEKT